MGSASTSKALKAGFAQTSVGVMAKLFYYFTVASWPKVSVHDCICVYAHVGIGKICCAEHPSMEQRVMVKIS